jgi:pyridoxamine 5'-phosphate oxidase
MDGVSLFDVRRDYASRRLAREDLATTPWEQLEAWLAQAAEVDPEDYNAVHLATVGSDGMPSGRIVLARGVSPAGVTFYTNYRSAKGRELEHAPRAAMTFFWKELERQVRIQGPVVRVPEEESNAYFASRPRSSQLGAWASEQSEPLPKGENLEARLEAVQRRFADTAEIPRPPDWGGFRLGFGSMECWQGRPSRLHDRWCYVASGSVWQLVQLFP